VIGSPSLTSTAPADSPAGSNALTAGHGSRAAANYAFPFADGTRVQLDALGGHRLGQVFSRWRGRPGRLLRSLPTRSYFV
jgi:hypothetical protein